MRLNDLICEFPPEISEPIRRLMDRVIHELSDSPTGTVFRQLSGAVETLAESVFELVAAQKTTAVLVDAPVVRIQELPQAQQTTEQILIQLIEAQIKRDEGLNRLEGIIETLVGEMKTIRKELGGLARAVGYRLEDEAIWVLPHLIPRNFAVEVRAQLRRETTRTSVSHQNEVATPVDGPLLQSMQLCL